MCVEEGEEGEEEGEEAAAEEAEEEEEEEDREEEEMGVYTVAWWRGREGERERESEIVW